MFRAATSTSRCLALSLAAILFFLPPLVHLDQARASTPGIKKLLLGGVAAAGGVMLLKSLFTSKATAAAGATVARSGILKSLGGLIGSRWWVIPAVIGVGALAYYLWKNHYSPMAYARDNLNRYDRTGGQRYDNPYYATQVYGSAAGYPGYGAGYLNNNAYGQYGSPMGYAALSFSDQLKMAVSGGSYVPMTAYASPTMVSGQQYGSVGGLPMLGAPAFSLRSPFPTNGLGTASIVGPNGISGTIFDVPGIGDPARLGRTDRIGRGVTGEDAVQLEGRTSFQPRAPESTTLSDAASAKDAAYKKMVEALQAASAGQNVDVKRAIEDYQAAEAKVKELSAK